MEHRHLDHHTVCRRESHTVSDTFSVVHHVVVGEHDSFREACRSRRILHVADVVRLYLRRKSCGLFRRHHIRPLICLFKCQTSRHAESVGYHVPQERERFAVKRLTRLAGFNLRAELVYDPRVVTVQSMVDHDERMRIGLTEQIFRLMDLVRGVHRDEYCADPAARPECDVPGRDIRAPYGDFVSRLDAHRHESPRESVDVLPELRICPGVIQCSIFETVLIRELLCHAVENLWECEVDELVLLPDIAPRAVVVIVQSVLTRP